MSAIEIGRSEAQHEQPVPPEAYDPTVPFATFLEKKVSDTEKLGIYRNFLAIVEEKQERLLTETNEQQIFYEMLTGERLVKSPYDRIRKDPVLISPELAAHAYTKQFYRIKYFLHPSRIENLQKFMAKGYKSTDKVPISVIEDAIRSNTALDFDDLGFLYESPPITGGEELIKGRKILESGQYSWIASNLVGSSYLLSSMPDNSNAESLAAHALDGGVGFSPFDSIWNTYENQHHVVERAWEIVQQNPILGAHPQREFLLTHIKRLLGVTLKTSSSGVEDMERYIDNGFTTFRFYNARSQNEELVPTAKKIRELVKSRFGSSVRDKLTLFFGQLTTPDQAREIEAILEDYAGLSFVVGIGGGGICRTPGETAQHIQNVNVGYRIIHSGIDKPVLFDGGTGDRAPIVHRMGGAGVFKSGALAGGTIEQPPGMWYFLLQNQYLAKLFSGEAAFRTKYLGGKTDYLDEPIIVEGSDDIVFFDPYILTLTQNDYLLHQSLSTAMVFARVQNVRDYANTHLQVGLATESARERSRVHHRNGLLSNIPQIEDYFPNTPLVKTGY